MEDGGAGAQGGGAGGEAGDDGLAEVGVGMGREVAVEGGGEEIGGGGGYAGEDDTVGIEELEEVVKGKGEVAAHAVESGAGGGMAGGGVGGEFFDGGSGWVRG